jgi:hypothetical protein
MDFYPMIDYAIIQEAQISWFVQERLNELITSERKKLDVLIVVPPQVKKCGLPKIVRLLKEKGFKNIIYSDSNEPKEPTFRDGLRLLVGDKGNNPGWRVVARALLLNDPFIAALKAGETTGMNPMSQFLRGGNMIHNDFEQLFQCGS